MVNHLVSFSRANKYYFLEDAAVFCLIALAVYLIFRARRRAYWVNAWRQVSHNKLAMISLVVISLYLVVGACDSIGWRDVARDKQGGIIKTKKGKIVYETAGLSLLDRFCDIIGLRGKPEKTYSAPLATHLYAKETVDLPDGTIKRDYPVLDYPGTHWFGTDKSGVDVLYRALKGVRTALIFGGFVSLLAIPLAIFFGVLAGFFGGWVDDIIQYMYITMSSVPGYLVIAAVVLSIGRSLFWLCLVMGVTGWTGLCRLLRAETLKLRELEYVQAAEAFGVSRPKIILRHIVPNLMHIVLIASVLGFCGLVMAEASLSYLGIGVGANTGSWGNMINDSRFELAREPVVWWTLVAAFGAMFVLVLSVNLFGSALRDALDPKLRTR